MKHDIFRIAALVLVLCAISCRPTPDPGADAADVGAGDERPLGLMVNDPAATQGYALHSLLVSNKTYLIDQEGQVVHMWTSDLAPGAGVYLLDNGNLLRPEREPDVAVFSGGGQSGRIREVTWDGEVVWDFVFAKKRHLSHHDIAPMPNGNVLAIAWEAKSAEEARAAGRRANRIPEGGLWPDMVVELQPIPPDDARVVWEWHAWDHLVQDVNPDLSNYGDPSQHLRRIDINGDEDPTITDDEQLEALRALGYVEEDESEEQVFSDLFHTNSVDYNPDLDQIVLSTPRFGEIWIIDHSTTTEEAAGTTGGRWGHGGDLLYRWGNANTYGRAMSAPRQLFGQHDARFIEPGLPGAGNLMIFNNNVPGPEDGDEEAAYSAVLELALPVDGSYLLPEEGAFGPAAPTWSYEAPDSFHSNFISGAHRLPNGNTLVTQGNMGRFFEVTPDGRTVWEFWTPYSGDVRNADGTPPHPINEEEQHAVFRVTKISPDHPALAGKVLVPLDPQPSVETAPWPKEEEEGAGEDSGDAAAEAESEP